MTKHNQDNQQKGSQEGRAVIYTRPVSSRVDQPYQTSSLEGLARVHGYTDVTVIADGHTPLRPGLQALILAITAPEEGKEPLGAIVVSSEERLFRDAESATLDAFIEACRQHGVVLISPSGVYDFANSPAHIQLFRRQCQEAYQYIADMVVSRLQAGRRAAAQQRKDPSTYVGEWRYPGRKRTSKREGN